MKPRGSNLWRVSFLLAAGLLLVGGPRHPDGTMAEMLAHRDWIPAHALMLAGFVALLIGMLTYGHGRALPDRTRRWLRLATIGTALQMVEMAFHTAAVVDQANLVAGRATPVLTTHLWLAVIVYPLFALTLIGFIVAGARDRVLGSWWIAWMGILGALAHGASAPLVVLLDVEGARILFRFLMLLALWVLLTGLWPLRITADASRREAPTHA